MALDREIEVGARHPGPIVGNANEPPPAAVGRDIDPGGAGIKRILDQFLDHARRAFDHFAGGDAVDRGFGKLADRHFSRPDSDVTKSIGAIWRLRGQRPTCPRYFALLG